jgi:hypothetical protein
MSGSVPPAPAGCVTAAAVVGVFGGGGVVGGGAARATFAATIIIMNVPAPTALPIARQPASATRFTFAMQVILRRCGAAPLVAHISAPLPGETKMEVPLHRLHHLLANG